MATPRPDAEPAAASVAPKLNDDEARRHLENVRDAAYQRLPDDLKKRISDGKTVQRKLGRSSRPSYLCCERSHGPSHPDKLRYPPADASEHLVTFVIADYALELLAHDRDLAVGFELDLTHAYETLRPVIAHGVKSLYDKHTARLTKSLDKPKKWVADALRFAREERQRCPDLSKSRIAVIVEKRLANERGVSRHWKTVSTEIRHLFEDAE